jgi:hypothetical protein
VKSILLSCDFDGIGYRTKMMTKNGRNFSGMKREILKQLLNSKSPDIYSDVIGRGGWGATYKE